MCARLTIWANAVTKNDPATQRLRGIQPNPSERRRCPVVVRTSMQ